MARQQNPNASEADLDQLSEDLYIQNTTEANQLMNTFSFNTINRNDKKAMELADQSNEHLFGEYDKTNKEWNFSPNFKHQYFYNVNSNTKRQLGQEYFKETLDMDPDDIKDIRITGQFDDKIGISNGYVAMITDKDGDSFPVIMYGDEGLNSNPYNQVQNIIKESERGTNNYNSAYTNPRTGEEYTIINDPTTRSPTNPKGTYTVVIDGKKGEEIQNGLTYEQAFQIMNGLSDVQMQQILTGNTQ